MPGKGPSAKAIGLVAAVFLLGGLVGVFGSVVLGRMDRRPRRERVVDRLTRVLDLNSRQRHEVKGIFADAHRRFTAAYRQSQKQARPQYDAIRQDVHARIRAILTPTQQVKFNRFLKRLDEEHRIHPPPPPGSRRRDR